MAALYPSRSAPLAIALFGVATNLVFATQVLGTSRSFKWETESEWETSMGNSGIDGIKVILGLLLIYFTSAASISALAFVGIAKNKSHYVRFYRDYFIADFSFCTFFTLVTIYGVYHTSAHATVCEELSRHPDLMREVLEMGLSVENCEQWLERAVLGFVAFMIILVIIRLYFLLSISNYYSHLVRYQELETILPTCRNVPRTQSTSRSKNGKTSTRQRIFFLSQSPFYPVPVTEADDEPIVYAPIPLSALPEDVVRDLKESAPEAWVSQLESSSCEHRLHRHQHHHHQRRSHGPGEISLPIRPNEGLLPESIKA